VGVRVFIEKLGESLVGHVNHLGKFVGVDWQREFQLFFLSVDFIEDRRDW
jgi:hypothetical protein